MEELLANQPMEYEEVLLKRSKSNRRLGLTLCYGGTDESETDIFVSEVRTLDFGSLTSLTTVSGDFVPF
jgi:hypothetical protein